MEQERGQAAVFLDRDGTINEEVGYLDRLEDLRLIPGAAEAVRRINAVGMKVVVITNQSGVARGFFDEAFVGRTHALLREILLREGARLDGLYFCPHHPREGRGKYLRVCDCRKPAPGMLLRAAEELRIDLSRSWVVGDTLKDIEAAARAGARGILVRTGLGEEELRKLDGGSVPSAARNGRAAEADPDRAIPGGSRPDNEGKRNPAEESLFPKSPGSGRTGSDGRSENGRDPRRPDFVAADLLEAVDWILRNREP